MVDVERGPGYLVKRVQQSLRRNCDAALRPTGLSMAQYTALRALATTRRPRPPSWRGCVSSRASRCKTC